MSNDSIHDRLRRINNNDPEKWLSSTILKEAQADFSALEKARKDAIAKGGSLPSVSPNEMNPPGRAANRPGGLPKDRNTYWDAVLDRRDEKEKLDPRGSLPDSQTRGIRSKIIGKGPLGTLAGDNQPLDAPSLDKLMGPSLDAITDQLSSIYSKSKVQNENETDEQFEDRKRLPLTLPGKKGGRKNANFNFMELLVAAHLTNPKISTVKEVIEATKSMKNISGASDYLADLQGRDPRKVLKALENLKNSKHNFVPDTDQIFLKNTNKMMAPESITQALAGLDDKVRRDKADVMFYDKKDKNYKGISIKDSPTAWEDSPSVEKLFKRISETNGTKDMGALLKDVRMQMHKDAGLPISEVDAFSKYGDQIYMDEDGKRHDSITGPLRKQLLSNLLSNTNSPYANLVSKQILGNPQFLTDWKRALFGEDLPYEFHKFN